MEPVSLDQEAVQLEPASEVLPAAGGVEPTGLPRSGAPRSPLAVLRHRHYRIVWFGAMGSSVGGWMESVGVQWIVAQATGSALWMGYIAAAQLGPTLVLGLHGGLLADRVNRKRLLLVTQFAMMLIAAMLMLASFEGWATPPVLLGLSLAQGVALAFNTPAWQVLTPRLVPREELSHAIALNGLQFNLARVVGPGLAGAIMTTSAAQGATILFAVNTASFLGVLWAVGLTPDDPAPPRPDTSAWRRTREALAFLFHGRGPRAVFLAMVVYSFGAAPLIRMLPLFVSEVYHRAEGTFGLMLSVMGSGAVVGVLILRYIPHWYPKHHFIPLSIGCSGVTIAAFAASPTLVPAAVALFFAGIFWLWAFNSSYAAMQLLVTHAMRGRVMAICNVAVFGAMPLGSVVAGLIGDYAAGRDNVGPGSQLGVGLMGVMLAAAGLVMLTWRTPEVDGLRPGDPGFGRRPGLVHGITARAHRPAR